MVMPCSRSAASPSTSSAKSISWPWVPTSLAVGFQRGQLVFEDHLAVIEQPPDQRGLAVIHRPAGDESQHGLVLMLLQIGVDILGDQRFGLVTGGAVICFGPGHQKYPSCFFFSMLAVASWSTARPSRSEVVAKSISWMISGKVAASLSVAPVSG